ncbi:MAG: glycosyltransferase family A protein, partial [Nitrososphaerales archaeon]
FLRRSVSSVLGQTGETGPLEVVVVKDFEDPFVDGLAVEGRINSLILPSGSVGEFLARGVAVCRGDVICFLDDDDVFAPTKLSEVRRVFAADSSVVYLHNGMQLRYDDGRPARGLFHQKTARDLLIDVDNHRQEAVERAFSLSLPINLSSVSVRRSVLLEHMDTLRTISGSTDYFCFYAALSSRSRLRFSSRVLTTYYIHSSALRPAGVDQEGARALQRLSRDQTHIHSWGASLAELGEARTVATSMLTEFEFLAKVIEPTSRRDLVRIYSRLATATLALRPLVVALATPIFLAGVVSRRLALTLLLVGRQVVRD